MLLFSDASFVWTALIIVAIALFTVLQLSYGNRFKTNNRNILRDIEVMQQRFIVSPTARMMAETREQLPVPLSTIETERSIEDIHHFLSVNRVSGGSITLWGLSAIVEEAFVLFCYFSGTEIIRGRNISYTVTRIYSGMVCLQKTSPGSLTIFGDYTENDNHDAYLSELIRRIKAAIAEPTIS